MTKLINRLFYSFCIWNAGFELELAKLGGNRDRIAYARRELSRWTWERDLHIARGML